MNYKKLVVLILAFQIGALIIYLIIDKPYIFIGAFIGAIITFILEEKGVNFGFYKKKSS